jgi:hypothetical protein
VAKKKTAASGFVVYLTRPPAEVIEAALVRLAVALAPRKEG